MVLLVLEDSQPLLYHNEPVWRDGELNGYVTSAMYGHTLGASVAMAYISHPDGVSDEFITGARYEIEIAGERHAARVALKPLYDPTNLRLRG
jgi:4-methylaminobutanoate oxidase (formaldehyde-forming)